MASVTRMRQSPSLYCARRLQATPMSARFAYSLLWRLALPFVSLRLLWRGQRQPGYLEAPGGRVARWPDAPERPLIWVHAVAVGESRAAQPLIRALRERHPDHDIVLT